MLTANCRGSLTAFAATLLPVVPFANRFKTGISMVITRDDVVHVGSRFLAAIPVRTPLLAAKSFAASYAILLLGWLFFAARPVPTALWVLGFLVGLPAFGCAVVFSRSFWNAGGSSVVTPTLAWARFLVVCSVGVLVTLMLAALIFLGFTPDETVLSGEPEVVAGANVLDQHGFRTPVSKSVYERAVLYDDRGWIVGSLVFSLAAIANLGATDERIAARRGPAR